MSNQSQLLKDVQAVLAGHSERDVATVLLQSLVIAIGVASENMTRAEAVIDALPTEMKPALRSGWDNFRKHRAMAGLVATH